ncbi:MULTISPECIES: DUF6875 domain-containing protein [unclassified Blastococcus]
MPTQTTDLLLPEDLGDAGRASRLPDGDRAALSAVADWIGTFIVRPHAELGRPGPVCPFVPGSLERRTLRLAAERITGRDARSVAELVQGYRTLFRAIEPGDGPDAQYDVIVVVFPDLPADRARGVFDEVLGRLAVPSYDEDGIVFGPFYDGHEGTAVHNPDFHPFRSPVPFLFIRRAVVDDWVFFLDQPDWLDRWARRFGAAAVHALAEELRRRPERAPRD